MKYILILIIRLYWLLKPKQKPQKCIFKKTCSHYVFDITKEQGFFKGFQALYFRYKNCRHGYEIFRNPITGKVQMILPSNFIIESKEISERILMKF